MDKVTEQYMRVKRSYTLFEEISTGKIHDRNSDYYQDTMYAFFQNCWHLKDWIINSKALDKETVEGFFHENKDMKLCQALAIGSKHLTINNPNVDSSVSIGKRLFSLSLGGGPTEIHVSYSVSREGLPPLDSFMLASACFAHVSGFLIKHGLLKEV